VLRKLIAIAAFDRLPELLKTTKEDTMKRSWSSRFASMVTVILLLIVNLAIPQPAEASIHEIIAAMCRHGGEEVMPPGQNRLDSKSFVRALQATGFISSIDASLTEVVIHFDPTVPNSKFMSAGFDLTIPDGFGPGVDLVLSPLVIPDPAFPAHAACANLR
jgi:hypothetical protein